MKGQEEYFIDGFFYAIAILNKLHNCPTICAKIIKETGLEDTDCTNFDSFEKEQLCIINKETGMNLKGV